MLDASYVLDKNTRYLKSEICKTNSFHKSAITQELDDPHNPNQDDGKELALSMPTCKWFENVDEPKTLRTKIETVLKILRTMMMMMMIYMTTVLISISTILLSAAHALDKELSWEFKEALGWMRWWYSRFFSISSNTWILYLWEENRKISEGGLKWCSVQSRRIGAHPCRWFWGVFLFERFVCLELDLEVG